ncbi:MAG: hypothetical protein ABJL55_12190 [Roseibium sp.]
MPVGSRLWIYATLPVGALVATASVLAIDYDEPYALWTRYNNKVAVSKNLFFDYFGECELGCAIQLTDVEKITPVPLAKIREIRGVSQIPQVAVKITHGEAEQFEQHRSGQFIQEIASH